MFLFVCLSFFCVCLIDEARRFLIAAFIVIIYITLKLIVPSWKLAYQRATKLVFIMGAGGGVLQGSAGLSAPVSITFLNSYLI